MLRPVIIFFNLLIAFFAYVFSSTPSAEVHVPATASPGESFLVSVDIHPNGETSFMRFSMTLPQGWTATPVDSAGGSFLFNHNTAKFQWFSVAGKGDFSVSFKVNVPADAKGDVYLTSKVSHTVDNRPDNISLPDSKITIGGAAVTQNNSQQNNTSNNQQSNTHVDSTAKPAVAVTATRSVPRDIVNSGEFDVSISVTKDDLSSFGKLEDSLPSGFTAQAIETDGSTFEFKNGVVRFNWFKLPAKTTLNVSYKVMVAPSVNGPRDIRGHFAYVEDEKGKVFSIPPSTVIISLDQAMTNNNQQQNSGQDNQQQSTQQQQNNSGENSNAQKQVNQQQNDNSNSQSNSQSQSNASNNSTGVNFCVQIAAMQRLVPVDYYTSTYHLSDPINMEQLSGLHKYITGNFTTYQGAHDDRDAIRGKGVNDAFVVAYNNTKRITVQEALMITSQKWIR